MRIQAIFQLVAASFLISNVALAACFDFSKKIEKPLADPIPLLESGDNSAKGKRDGGVVWAKARGRISLPISVLYGKLLDHNTTKSSRVDEMEVEKLNRPEFLALHKVKFLIKPFLFVKVRWTEEWGYSLLNGSPAAPEEIVIAYEKIDGTSYIEHLCGNIVLRKLPNGSTDVYMYEEAKATQRSADDTRNGLVGTLQTLRRSQ